MVTAYNQIGGRQALESLVELFYLNVITDPRIAHFFEGMDMARQIKKQQAFLTMVLGGSTKYTGEDLRESHAPLVEKGLNDEHFDAFVEDFLKAMEKFEVSPEVMNEVVAIIESKRDDVLCR